jgi:NDP-sugar pyrophosphorylase family protein
VKALILCAGLGTRLGELTRETPKPLLPVGGEPLIAHTLRYLAYHGFGRVAINLHFKASLIRAFVGTGERFGVQVTYSLEEQLLGTAGAVKRLAEFWRGEREFLVIYGDLLVDEDLGAMLAFHRSRAAAATLLLHQRAESNSLVYMEPDGRITAFVERPGEEERGTTPHAWVNSGVQILCPSILEAIPDDRPSDLPRDVYVPLLTRVPIFGHPLGGYRCAIDSPSRYAEAQEGFSTGRYRPPFRPRTNE